MFSCQCGFKTVNQDIYNTHMHSEHQRVDIANNAVNNEVNDTVSNAVLSDSTLNLVGSIVSQVLS